MNTQCPKPLRIFPLIGVILVALALAAEGRSELITFKFAGTVTEVSVIQNPSPFDFPDVGDPFTGSYTFDSTAPDDPSPEQGSFRTLLPERALVVSIGDLRFEGPANAINVFQNIYEVSDIEPFHLTSHPELAHLTRRNFSLRVKKDNLFSDPNILPLSPPSLTGAVERYLVMAMDDGRPSPIPFVTILASLDSLTVVPEPASLSVPGLGLLAVGALRPKLRTEGTGV